MWFNSDEKLRQSEVSIQAYHVTFLGTSYSTETLSEDTSPFSPRKFQLLWYILKVSFTREHVPNIFPSAFILAQQSDSETCWWQVTSIELC